MHLLELFFGFTNKPGSEKISLKNNEGKQDRSKTFSKAHAAYIRFKPANRNRKA
jgi:hypothetical protein